jgi:hypothetical protein
MGLVKAMGFMVAGAGIMLITLIVIGLALQGSQTTDSNSIPPIRNLGSQYVPQSLVFPRRLVVMAYDSLKHHSERHYQKLAELVQHEFRLTDTTILVPVRLVFISEPQYRALEIQNSSRWDTGWVGYYIEPGIILIRGHEEQDDTFMHEYMHALNKHGLIFGDVPERYIHNLIYTDEGLLLASSSYLQFLNTKEGTE